MKNTHLQIVTKKLSKWRKKIIYADELKSLIAKVLGDNYTDTKAYKFIYYLKNRWYIVSIKKTIFYVKYPEDHISESLILEDYYWQILHQHCTESLAKQRYIWGLKALELNLNNFEIPDTVLIVNPDKQSKETVVAAKHIQFKKYTTKQENFFTKFKKFTHKVKMGKYSFAIASKELALLECMYNYDETFDRYTYELVKKVIKRSTQIDETVIAKIIKLGKHHTSINRLYKIAKSNNKTFAEKLAVIIKRYSFFLDV